MFINKSQSINKYRMRFIVLETTEMQKGNKLIYVKLEFKQLNKLKYLRELYQIKYKIIINKIIINKIIHQGKIPRIKFNKLFKNSNKI